MPLTQTMFTGMDMDTAYSLRNQKKYFKLRNGTLTIDEELGVGTIANVNGTTRSVQFPSVTQPASVDTKTIPPTANHVIIGAVVVDEYIVLFTTAVGNTTPPGGGSAPSIGAIWAFQYDDSDDSVTDAVWNGIAYVLDCDIHLKFYDYLAFYTDHTIRAIGNSENDDIKKVYFTDGLNNVRVINIVETDIANEDLDHLELAENVTFTQAKAHVVPGGRFYPGSVQYAFQLFSYGGSETSFSPATNFVNISDADGSLSSSATFKGTEYLEGGNPTGKAVKIEINNPDKNFGYIRIVRVFYKTEYAVPNIDIVAEFGIDDNETIAFTDNGDITLGSLSVQEYVTMGGVIFAAKDLATSNNRLIAANIDEYFYNPTYDARTYRFNNAATPVCKLEDAATNDYIILQEDGSWEQFDEFGGSVTTGIGWTIPTDFYLAEDLVDPYVWSDIGFGQERGGRGEFISYTFKTVRYINDFNRLTVPDFPAGAGVGDNTDHMGRNALEMGCSAPNASVNNTTHDCNWETSGVHALQGDGFQDNTDGYTNYASDINSSTILGYQRGETYRFGIVFFNKKGRNSFVNWIEDIKFPETWESNLPGSADLDYKLTDASLSGVQIEYSYGRALYIQFKILQFPLDAVSYQIVRLNRDSNNKSILGSGYITPVFKGGEADDNESRYKPPGAMYRMNIEASTAGTARRMTHRSVSTCESINFGSTLQCPPNYGDNLDRHVSTYSDRLFNFFSPEISFLKTVPLSNTYLKVVATINPDRSSEFAAFTRGDTGTIDNPYNLFFKCGELNTVDAANMDVADEINFDSHVLVTTATGFAAINIFTGVEYTHAYRTSQTTDDSGGNFLDERFWSAQGGAGLVGYSDTNMSTKLAKWRASYVIPYAQLRRNLSSQYGGFTDAERKTSKYIPASNLNPTTNSDVSVFGGDTYVSMFEHTRLYGIHNHASTDDTFRTQEGGQGALNKDTINVVVIPTETSINIEWRADERYTQAPPATRMAMRETKGSHDQYDVIYNQETDSYLMNWAYLQDNDVINFQEEPLFLDLLATQLSHRMMASDAKYDGEISDSWLKFKPNNFSDVSGENGPLRAIEALGEHLYFFQRKGVGVTKIDERALVNDTEGVSLVLGTGDIFSKYQYVANDISVIGPDSITKGRQGIYFYDSMNKTIAVLGSNGATDLARLTGVRTYIKNNLDKDLDHIDCDVIAGFDPTIDMVYFTFYNNYTPRVNDDYTIGYSEVVKDFVSLYDFAAKGYLSDRTRFLSWSRVAPAILHMHNVGVKGEFYETQFDTTLTLLISDQPAITKVFDGVEYTHDADETLTFPPATSQTFSRIRAYNNFLDTGLVTINPKFRFRTWRAKFPRYTEGLKTHRLIGKYLKIDLEFDNSTNNELYLQPMVTTWRPVAFIQP